MLMHGDQAVRWECGHFIVLTKLQKQKLEEHAAKLGIGVSALIRLPVSEWLEARADRE